MNNPKIDFTKQITPAEFLKAELEMGISFDNESFVRLADNTANQIFDLNIKSVLDYGAGTGVYAESYRKLGYDVYVYEVWNEHKNYIKTNAPLLKIVEKPITTDLMNFIEVAEHLTDKELNWLFKAISPKYILFSSTSEKTDWDYAWGHINIKSQNEWINFYSSIGYSLIRHLNFPTAYSKLFIKNENSISTNR